MPNWLANLPWWIKLPAFLAGSLMSAFSSKLPDGLQTAGLYLGLGLAVVVAAATIWHCIDLWRVRRGRPRLKLEPSHIIILGLLIALAGAIWQWRRGTPPDPHVTALQIEIANLRTQLASPMRALDVASQVSPATPVKTYNEIEVQRLLDALTDAQKLVDNVISPPYFRIESLMFNTEYHNGVRNYAQNLTDLRDKIRNEVWPKIDDFVYKTNAAFKDEMRYALALEQEATKGESLRKLDIAIEAIKKLPENPSMDLTQLVQPQLKAVAAEIQPNVYTWIGLARQRIPKMIKTLRDNGTITYEKK